MGKKKKNTTFGTLALALFWLVLISGIFLAIPFDVQTPYLSISNMLVGNPWAAFIRNLHFWSSQFFLIFSLIHIYDHFHFKKKIGLKTGIALRLSLGVLIIFLTMLSGFLLKGDADSEQARQILNTLIQYIPFFGKSLAFSLLGNEGRYQLIYVHHIATFTVFITVIMIEHSRKSWPPIGDFILSFAATLALSYFFGAPLHDNINPTIKGPWYFVGFQEILHWLRHPGWSLLLFLVLLILIYIVNAKKNRAVFFSKRILLTFTIFYLFLTIIGLFFRGENWKWAFPGQTEYSYHVLHNFKTSTINFTHEFTTKEVVASPVIQGRKESCLLCHTKTYGFADAHKPEAIGCFSCHSGNPFATGKTQAHRNMIKIPGNLSNAKQTCGTTQCHPEIAERVPMGLMGTLSGIISVDRTVFGEQVDPDILTDVHRLENSAADEHLRNLCVRCHLGNPKTEFGPVNETSRGGGCLACHLNYSKKAEKELTENSSTILTTHPSVSLQVSNNHCFGCHSRSGRIATNYEGWHETTLLKEEMPDSSNYRLIEGSRVFIKKQEDVHHKLGLECIDCHNSYELMGDGNLYAHEEEQQDVQCSDCHLSGEPNLIPAAKLDNESALIAALRFGDISEKKFLTTQKYNRPLVNTYLKNDTSFFVTKNRNEKFVLKPPAKVCVRDSAHSALSCSSCHSSWAPSCIGCHNLYDPKEPGYNMILNKEKQGSWVEYVGTYSAKLPTLGIRETETGNEIIPVVPGMVLTIDKGSFSKELHDSLLFQRLFAPSAPHTTAAKGRSCKSCHNNPVALGFGEGELKYKITENKGRWVFNSFFKNNEHDDLPGDAWTGFLQNCTGMVSTRKNVFPFNVEQQKKILTVGACLTCHSEDSEVMKKSLNSFEELVEKRSLKCILPE
ncbi:MAG: hypothetical protein L3J11_06640 [Draconibacterium sp.]|nr:hypothetical protein [Draconibacterium sp.]